MRSLIHSTPKDSMRIRKLAAVAALLLSGCQAMVYGTASDFDKIALGMTKAQVIQTLGSPVSVSADGDKGEEYLIYKRMKHAISAWPRTYSVTVRGGKVVKYGEQYEESNINHF
jgi:outer membrane protein assembly factor BamE (lipoprotein component of BamABCDE complex)